MRNLKNKQMNVYNKRRIRLTDIEKWVITSGEREEGGKIGVGDQEIQTTTYKIDNQQGYIAQHREI